MSFEALSERLAALQDSNIQLRDLIHRLANIKFQPGSVPLGNEEDNVKEELASEINQTIKDQEDDLDLLKEEIIDMDTRPQGSEPDQQRELEQQKDSLGRETKRAIEELNGLVIAFRKAQTSSRRSLLEAQRQERELLLRSYLNPKQSTPGQGQQSQLRQKQRPSNLSSEDKEVNASTDVTLALRRTHDMMVSELSRSQFAHDTLKESTAALAELGETYSMVDTLLSSSKNLLGTLLRSQKSDTWYLETAFYILAVTIGWLVFRRLLYGPTWWLVYLPLKLFYRAWYNVFVAIGLLGGSGVDVVTVTSIVGGQTSIFQSTVNPTVISPGAASVRVPASARETDASRGQGSASEEVGRIIDESQDHPTREQDTEPANADELEQGEEPQAPRNPKKRMWEEEKEAPKEAQRKKDEL